MLRNLIGLELRKHHIGGYIRNAIIANIVAIAVLFLMLYSPNMMEEVVFADYTALFVGVDSFVRMIFIVFAAVLISRFIIDEYKSKTINILFMYPISRKKILLSKLAIIAIFTFSNIIVSEIVLNAILLTANAIVPIIQEPLTLSIIGGGALKLIMNAMAASIMSLIPLYFGMKKYSTPTTIMSSLLIVSIVCSNNGGVSLNSIIIVPIILALIGAFVMYMTIKKVEHVDVVN
ncbi:ABC transporter permease [Paenibacillus popilliae]|uniref:ABC transporter permease n=1 Tax=Paenibacillus popilliae TaxID=78057 RepID=A0ABY3AL51_PAEPP|nr:ABC transporter permease [Paenibacillus sp. SDF0028]TQR43334.1 ABC transporter permease [Paenibacillus sp. SDF0028]